MKIGRIAFSRMVLATTLGLDSDVFKEMLDNLPKDSKIVGFGSDPTSLVDYVFVQNDIFKDTPDGQVPPEITVSFTRRYDGTSFCSGVNYQAALPSSMGQVQNVTHFGTPSGFGTSSAPNGGANQPTLVRCAKAPWPKTEHDFKVYVGLQFSEESCTYCGAKKP